MMNIEQQLISRAEAYCAANNMELSTLGRMIVNDGKFFKRISDGGSCTMKTLQKVDAWLKENGKKRNRKK